MAIVAGVVVGGGVALTHTIGGMFASSAKLRAQKEALRILNEARQAGTQAAKEYSAEFKPFLDASQRDFDAAGEELSENRNLIQSLMRDFSSESVEVPVGFSEADTIALKDAQRLLNENMVSTGNLRSGSAGFYNMDLARRFAADVSSRSFERKVQQANLNLQRGQLLFGGAQLLQGGTSSRINMGTSRGTIGVQGKGLAAQLFQASMGIAPAAAMAAAGVGDARASGFMAPAQGLASGLSSGMAAYSTYQGAQESQAYTDYLKSKA